MYIICTYDNEPKNKSYFSSLCKCGILFVTTVDGDIDDGDEDDDDDGEGEMGDFDETGPNEAGNVSAAPNPKLELELVLESAASEGLGSTLESASVPEVGVVDPNSFNEPPGSDDVTCVGDLDDITDPGVGRSGVDSSVPFSSPYSAIFSIFFIMVIGYPIGNLSSIKLIS